MSAEVVVASADLERVVRLALRQFGLSRADAEAVERCRHPEPARPVPNPDGALIAIDRLEASVAEAEAAMSEYRARIEDYEAVVAKLEDELAERRAEEARKSGVSAPSAPSYRPGRPPYGFRWLHGALEPVEAEQANVTLIQRWRLQGWTLRQIAGELNKRG